MHLDSCSDLSDAASVSDSWGCAFGNYEIHADPDIENDDDSFDDDGDIFV